MALILGSTYRFSLTATKDGDVWDLTSATVTLSLRKPDGTTIDRTATVVSPSAGTARYDCTTTDLSVAGSWRRSWIVSQSGVVLESAPINFYVEASP